MSLQIYLSQRFQPLVIIKKKPSLRFPRLKPWAIVVFTPKFVTRFSYQTGKAKSPPLAPVEVEILLCRGSAQKIAAENGTILTENAKSFCSKKKITISINEKSPYS